MYAAFAALTDKMDPKYIIPSEAYESHNDAHPKKTFQNDFFKASKCF